MFLRDATIDSRLVLYAMGSVALLLILFFCAKAHPKLRRTFVLLTILCNVVYLCWRVAYTLPVSFGALSIVMGVLLLAAELVGFFQSVVFRMIFVKRGQTRPHTPDEWDALPTVDILIATYNENIPLLRKTLVACKNLDYPADRCRVYLCDDGNRKEARELCEELHAGYFARTEHLHAKAGNLNNALSQTNGEFVMLLDADMVPKSSFLKKTIGNFVEPDVGFVQTPQMFYNPDPFQFNLHMHQRIPNEQDLFMMEIQEARAKYNALLHVGTNAVFRRKALDDIGGIPVGTITEDMATGMLIQSKGYRSVFIKEVLCTGLSVESFKDLIHQRERWCRGNIQVVKKWNPLTIKGLTPAQRMIYADGLLYWFFGVQKIIYILCPILYLLFGTIILNASPYGLLLFWLPSFLGTFLSYRALVQNSRSLTWRHIYEVAMAPYLALSALVETIFSRPIPFRVTPKGMSGERTTFAFRTALPFLILLALTFAGWGIVIRNTVQGTGNPASTVVNLVWSLYNAFAITISILVCIERPRKRIAERVATDESVTVTMNRLYQCRMDDLSETGARIECLHADNTNHIGQHVHIGSDATGEIDATVVWEKMIDGQKYIGVAFSQYPPETYQKLLKTVSDLNKGYYENR